MPFHFSGTGTLLFEEDIDIADEVDVMESNMIQDVKLIWSASKMSWFLLLVDDDDDDDEDDREVMVFWMICDDVK